jgi:hypothetical protein
MRIRFIAAVAMLLLLTGSTAFAQGLVVETQSNSAQAASWLAGAQVGHNWQSGSLVYGI